ncbi:hypothetical protein D3C81_1800890 [compost metagenome]
MKNRLYILAAKIPTMIPPNTPVASVGIPSTFAYAAFVPIMLGVTPITEPIVIFITR